MKFYDYALYQLRKGDKNLREVFNITFGFGDEVFFEEYDGVTVKKTLYRDAEARIFTTASYIKEKLAGIEKNSVVGLDLPNSPLWVIAFWGIIAAGFRPMLVHRTASELDASGALADAGARAVISDREFDSLINIDAASLPAEGAECAPDRNFEFANEILLMTSGVSGAPKIFAFDGDAVAAQILNSGYVLKRNSSIKRFYRGSIKLLCVLPFCHIYGLVTILLWFGFFGRTLVFPRDLSPTSLRSTCSVCGVTHIFAVPMLWDTVASSVVRESKKSGEYDKLTRGVSLSIKLQNIFPRLGERISARLFRRVRRQVFGEGVKFCINGGGNVGVETLRLINAIGYPLYNGYGMTEIGIGSVELLRRSGKKLEGSIGSPFPSIEYELRKNDCGDDILWVRGASLFTASYSGGVRSEHKKDEWFATGDVASKGRDGRYYIHGRSDEIFSGLDGERISLCEIEKNLHPAGVRRVAAIGLDGGVVLAVEPSAAMFGKHRSALAETVDKRNRTLPTGSRIRAVYLVSGGFPLTHNGKIRRRLLASGIADGSIPYEELRLSVCESADEYLDADRERLVGEICVIFADLFGVDAGTVTTNTHFLYDLSGGSLQYFELLSRISDKYDVDLKISDGKSCATPAEFAELILNNADN